MGLFQFILILVIALSLIEAGTKIMLPVARRLSELLGESAQEKRARREGQEMGLLPSQIIAELEERLTRIEDRLEFLEELRAPARRQSLSSGDDASGDAG